MSPETNSTTSIICSVCGLPNIPERQTCKRCHAQLQPTAQERQHIAATAQQNRGAWLRLIFPLIIVFVIMPIIFFTVIVPQLQWNARQPDFIPAPRGSMILAIRLPATVQPPQEIEVYKNGLAAGGPVADLYEGQAHVRQHLSEDLVQNLTALSQAWCQHTPKLRAIRANEPAYGLGISCPGSTLRIKVPIEQLPSELHELIVTVFPQHT
jgi:hypothetical protein